MPDLAPQRDAILTALERLLAWSEIARSPQLGKFLDYIVRRTLDGEGASIKAYSIAVDVLGRPTGFDPQTDPIVRVQARRLRSLLTEYYAGEGAGEPIRISLPTGRYVPEFSCLGDSVEPVIVIPESIPAPIAPRASARAVAAGGITLSWFALAVFTLAIAVAAFAFSTWAPPEAGNEVAAAGAVSVPSVTVVEFQNLAGSAKGGPSVAGLAIELVTDLEQFGDIDVHYGAGGDSSIAVVDLPTSDYILTGIVRPDGLLVQYSAILTESSTGDVVWNHTIPMSAQASVQPGVLDEVSRRLSLVLGSPRGPLHVAARRALAGDGLPERGVNLYLCRMLFSMYRETATPKAADRAGACMAALVEHDRMSAVGLAISSSLMADSAGSVGAVTAADGGKLALARDGIARAISQTPLDAFIWEQHARLREAGGEFDHARTDFTSAIQLNPANSDALAAYSLLLALGGNLDEAEPMARAAAEDTPAPPAWYHCVPALLALRDGDYAAAIASGEIYAGADRELGLVLTILAAQRAGDGAVVDRYLPQLLDVPSFRRDGVLTRLLTRVRDDKLMDEIREGMLAAGVPEHALTAGF